MLKGAQQAGDAYYSHLRDEFVRMFPERARRVLDIGCATGEALGHFKRLGAEQLVGIELRSDVAELARASGNPGVVHVGDFMALELPYAPGHFDVALASFVLEHVPDPSAALTKIRALLAETGVLIASLPNVRHISVSVPLLFRGKWEYADDGIMDRTHLRFFSRSTILSTLAEAGFEVVRIEPEIRGLKNVVLHRLTLGLFPDLFAYAFNFVAKPKIAA